MGAASHSLVRGLIKTLSRVRLIARLDVKSPDLIKGVHLEGWRKVGDPGAFARRYYAEGIDELLYIDAVASLYQRNTIVDLISSTARDVFIPITVGGGVRSVADARALLRAGADKIAVNTAALQRPELVDGISRAFGSQCMVLSVQAKEIRKGHWEAYGDLGREHSGRDVLEWVREGEARGAGEILLTSVDRDGTANGFDLDLIRAVTDTVSIPVIASGGLGTADHLARAVLEGGADAVSVAYALHFGKVTVALLRSHALAHGIDVRTDA